MNRWNRPARTSSLSASRTGSLKSKISKTLATADVLTVAAAVLSALTGFGILTPAEAADATGQVSGLAGLVETLFAAGFAVFAAGSQLVRYLRLAIGG